VHRLQELQAATARAMREFRRRYGDALMGWTDAAWEQGIACNDEPLEAGGVRLSLAELSLAQLQVMQGYGADLVRGVTEEIIGQINAQLVLATTGVVSPHESMKAVTRILGVHKGQKSIGSVAVRAERIYRTEMTRARSMATQARQNQAAEAIPDLEKVWLATGDTRTRDAHLTAHGQAVPVDGKFTVGGERLRFPGDPRGSARNVIN
jgi:hypothetical protein